MKTVESPAKDLLSPRTSTPKFQFCPGLNSWCGGGSHRNNHNDRTVPNTPEAPPGLIRTTPNADTDLFFMDADREFTIEKVKSPEETTAIWNRFLSLLWILLAAKYWKQQQQEKKEQEENEKSMPPVLSERTADTFQMDDEDEL